MGVLPFWMILFVNAANPNSNASGSFGFVRVIRLIRVFRVFKFGRYSIGLQMFAGALKGSVQPMGILVFVMSINMIIVSSVVHIVELAIPDEDQSEAHLRCFGTIARTFWWSMVTMTTVGYGDCSPLSPLGKMFADDAAMYSMTDMDGDGLVDEMELREFLTKKRKEGVLREVIDQTVLDPAQEVHDMHTKVTQQERQLLTMEKMVNRRMTAIEDFLAKMGKHVEARGS